MPSVSQSVRTSGTDISRIIPTFHLPFPPPPPGPAIAFAVLDIHTSYTYIIDVDGLGAYQSRPLYVRPTGWPGPGWGRIWVDSRSVVCICICTVVSPPSPPYHVPSQVQFHPAHLSDRSERHALVAVAVAA